MNTEVHDKLGQFLQTLEKDFTSVSTRTGNDLVFERECHFARQLIAKNDYSVGIARSNMQSLKDAISNVAAIGLTLNPASSYAYLVPRDGAIMLDVSYRGLCKLSTDTGVIEWVQAEMVHKNDTYKNTGLNTPPVHEKDSFGDRGEFVGVYCTAKTTKGDYLTEEMSAAEIYEIRNLSKAYATAEAKNKKNSVWHKFFSQMAIKTVVKRASKMWPVSQGAEQLHTAVSMLNQQDGNDELVDGAYPERYTEDQHRRFHDAINAGDAADVYTMTRTLDTEVMTALANSFVDGKKTSGKKKLADLERSGRDVLENIAQQIDGLHDADDSHGAIELLQEYTTDQQIQIHALMRDKQVSDWAQNSMRDAA